MKITEKKQLKKIIQKTLNESKLDYNRLKSYLTHLDTGLSKEQLEKAFKIYESCISSEMSILDTSRLIMKELNLNRNQLQIGDLVRVFRDNYYKIQKK